jgi:DNA integrity scanning protein DisA with diadenylate cyclase activity
MDKLFAIDPETQDVLVSVSPKGSKVINQIARISRNDNELLYHAVKTLTIVSTAQAFDLKLFKAVDKVCQFIYLGVVSRNEC